MTDGSEWIVMNFGLFLWVGVLSILIQDSPSGLLISKGNINMKEIKVSDKYKILVIPHNYQLCEFVEGGKQVRNVKTGEMTTQKSEWKNRDVFYANLNAMVKHIARLEADEKAADLNEWLAEFELSLERFTFNNGN